MARHSGVLLQRRILVSDANCARHTCYCNAWGKGPLRPGCRRFLVVQPVPLLTSPRVSQTIQQISL